MHNLVVSITGLGYVGLPIAAAFAEHCKVIGFDINQHRINQLNNKLDITKEVSSTQLASENLSFTSELSTLSQANFHIITVPTPVTRANHPDFGPLKAASRAIGSILKSGDYVVYESTVYPGATEEVCIPILEQQSHLKAGVDFFVGYSPERINPGDKVHTLQTITKIVSAQTPQSLEHVAAVYSLVVKSNVYKAPCIKVAEAAKVIENTQRDLNIALMNELALIFNRLDLDTLDVLEAAGTKWNFLPFKPGLVGGHCIGVDPYYLTYKSKQVGYRPEVILSGRRINDNMGKYIVQEVIKTLIKRGSVSCGLRIGILGVTFKENCSDVRNSKVFTIIDELKDYGFEVLIHDPLVSALPIENQSNLDLQPLTHFINLDAVILCVSHNEFTQLTITDFEQMLKPNGLVYDVKGCIDRQLAQTASFTLKRL